MLALRTMATSLGLAGAAIMLASPALAEGRWELLGQRSVSFQVERDTVAARHEGRFTTIRLCVANNAVHFRYVEVAFENGERQQVAVNRNLAPGQCSPNLDLRGIARRIDHVSLVYNTIPNFGGRAMVSVYGYHLASAGPGPGPGPGYPPGGRWDTIGVRTVGFHIDRDTVSGEGEGRFVALRLCVQRNAVHFREVHVTFANGESQQLAVNRYIAPGQCTPALDLQGRARRIREVVMIYNTVPNFQGRAQVTVQGLHPAVEGPGPGPGPAAGRWDTIGVRTVGFHIDRDTISGEGEGRFVALRFCVQRNAVHFREVFVTFRNGESQQLSINRYIAPGQCTQALDLQGRARRIREVVMLYNTVPNFQGRAQVTLQGLHPAGDYRPGQPGTQGADWEPLGTRRVGFGVDRDTISGIANVRYRAIRLCVAENAIQFRDLTVNFLNGEIQHIPVRSHFAPGQCTGPLDLSGEFRRIREIVMLYNTIPNFQGQAYVTLYGLR